MCFSATASAQKKGDDWEDDTWEEGKGPKPNAAKPDGTKTAPAEQAQPPKPRSAKKHKEAKRDSSDERAKDRADDHASDGEDLPVWLGASLGFFFENGAIRDDNRVEALRDNQDQEYDADLDPSVMLQLWLPLSEMFRVSTGLRYGGTYDVSTGENDDDVYVFGHQLEAHVGLEAWINAFAGIDVVVGLRGGFGVIFPTDDLDAEIDRAQGQGADAWSTPRLGLLFAPVAGARWQIADMVAIRGDVSVAFGRYFLFNYSGDIAGVYYERSAVANFTRYEFTAGIEFALGSL